MTETTSVFNGQLDLLADLGFKKVAGKVEKLKETKRKMMIAYEHFRYVTQDKIDAFNSKIKAESLWEKREGSRVERRFKRLSFIPVEDYNEVPPIEVLLQMKTAKEKKCFDRFEVAKIEAVVEIEDPIIFGRIDGCPDRFFIAQWDHDVKISDILKDNEG